MSAYLLIFYAYCKKNIKPPKNGGPEADLEGPRGVEVLALGVGPLDQGGVEAEGAHQLDQADH